MTVPTQTSARLVPDKGLEPLRLAARESRSRVSANSANPANNWGELNWLSYSRRTFLLSKEKFVVLYTTPSPQDSSYKVSFQETLSLLKPEFRKHLYSALSQLEVRKRNSRQSLQCAPSDISPSFTPGVEFLLIFAKYGTQRKIKRFVWLNFIGYISVSLPFSRWMQRLLRL